MIARLRAEPEGFGWVDERGPGHWDPVLPGPTPAWGGHKSKRDYIVAVYCCVGTIQTCTRPL
eukprot:10792575-Alexandrium_andersonii.AAC.1